MMINKNTMLDNPGQCFDIVSIIDSLCNTQLSQFINLVVYATKNHVN
jgi:hypothetical protein